MCHSTIWCNSYNKKGNQWRACVILQKDGLRKKTHFVTEFLSPVKNISKCLQSLEQRHKDSERAEWDGKKLLSLGNKLRPKHHKCRSNGELEVATIEQTGHKSRPFVWSKGLRRSWTCAENLFRQSEQRWELRREHSTERVTIIARIKIADERMDPRKCNKKYAGKQKSGGQMCFPMKDTMTLKIKEWITQPAKSIQNNYPWYLPW